MGAVLFSQPLEEITASGVSPNILASPLTKLAVDITVTAVAGSGTVAPVIDRLGADGVWYPIWDPAALTEAGVTSTDIGPGLTVTKVLTGTLRFRWVITGTSVTYSVSIVGE